MENKWIEDLYNRELARLQPILDAIDASPNSSIDINGYVCSKNLRGYNIGADEYGMGMISVLPEKERKGVKGTYKSKGITYCGQLDVPLGDVIISGEGGPTRVRDVSLTRIQQDSSKNTILENALEFRSISRNTNEETRKSIQKVLVMLKALGVELTPEENIAFLRGRKEELETELAQVNEQLNQKDSQQK